MSERRGREGGFFQTGRDHLACLVDRTRLRLLERLELARAKGRLEATPDRFSGAYVSRDRLSDAAAAEAGAAETDRLAGIRRELSEVKATLSGRAAGAREVGIRLPLDRIRTGFGLSDDAVEILLLAVATELSEEVRRTVALLQDDLTRQTPDGSLAASLVATHEDERLRILDELRLDAPLLRHRLLVPEHPKDLDRISALRMQLMPARRVVEFLQDDSGVDPALEGVATLLVVPRRPVGPCESLVLQPSEVEQITASVGELVARMESSPVPAPILTIRGPSGSGRHTIAANVAGLLRRGALKVDLGKLGPMAPSVAVTNLCREARLLDAVLVVGGLDDASDDLRKELTASKAAEEVPWIVCTEPEERGLHALGRAHMLLTLSVPGFESRCEIWRRNTRRLGTPLSHEMILQIASRFRVTGGTIAEVVAEVAAVGAGGGAGALDLQALDDALSRRASHRLGDLADTLRPAEGWSQLIAPPSVRESLELIVAQYQLGDRVFSEWGFDQVLSRRGLTALFHGPPGTGKTLASRVLARALDLEVYRVDVSRIVSKYVGETEKNLATIFDEASSGQVILLFDEADSLFGARTAVRSSSDRYANLETNYLLQRIEGFEGIVILTTNLDSSIDEAFARRLNFRVYFPPPEQDDRERLWRLLVPSGASGDNVIDYPKLAAHFEMSGGHIANAAIKAAFMAAGQGGNLAMEHLFEAASDEYRSMGKLVRDPSADKKTGRN